MAIFLCAVRRGEGLPTRPLDEAEDPSTVTVDGYDEPIGLLGDDRFEADVQLDGLTAWEVVAYEGERVGRGTFDGTARVILSREVSRVPAGAWLARLVATGDGAVRQRAVAMLEGAHTAEALRAK